MPTPTKGPRIGGGPAHERLILANLATALFEHDQITTTQAKAKRLRPLAERLITFAKRGDLHARRKVMTVIRDKGVVHRLFVEIAPDMAEREGGYTRITKIAPRKGDNAPMAVIELVREPVNAKPKRAVVAEAEATTARAAKGAEHEAPQATDGAVVAGSVPLQEGEYELVTVVDDAAADSARAVTVLPGGGFLVLDTELTDELRAEGVARDMIRAIQQARKDADLQVSDRIRTHVAADAQTVAAVAANRELVQSETLSRELELLEADEPSVTVAVIDE